MKLLFLFLALCAWLSLGLCDPCDWNAATPEAYRDYYTECPPIRRIKPDGHCDLTNAKNCNGFCQVKTTFYYDGEYPLTGTYSRGPGAFGSSDWQRFGMFWEEPIKPVPKGYPFEGFQSGISGGLSRASRGLAEVTHQDILLDEGQCGYFTFLPMTKSVCGTYTYAKNGPKCDKKAKSFGNVCYSERSNHGVFSGFYGWAGQAGEPSVRGHASHSSLFAGHYTDFTQTTFVYTNCNDGTRLAAEKQGARYGLAMRKGAAFDHDKYEAWRNVWNNPLISDKFLGQRYGFNDKGLICLSTISESDKRLLDAEVNYCWYRLGELMKTPDKLLPIKSRGHQYLDRTFYGGCSIYVKYNEDWSKNCKVTYAEFAAAAAPITFDCLKMQFKKGKNHWGVKGTHILRPVGSGCGSQVVMWGGSGHGINIGDKSFADVSGLDNLTLSVLETLNTTIVSPVEFGDPIDPDQPFGPLGFNGTGLQYEP